MSNKKVIYFIQTLGKKERINIIKKNKITIPDIQIIKSINGYNKLETEKYYYKSNLKYISLQFETYGTLANFLSKLNIFKYQIQKNIEYICLIEDDLLLGKNFTKFVESNLHYLNENNILRLGEWGEGYIVSLKGAKNIVTDIYNKGILNNIDNQLRLNCGKEKRIYNTPWKLVIPTNQGDCLKTDTIPEKIIKKFKNL